MTHCFTISCGTCHATLVSGPTDDPKGHRPAVQWCPKCRQLVATDISVVTQWNAAN